MASSEDRVEIGGQNASGHTRRDSLVFRAARKFTQSPSEAFLKSGQLMGQMARSAWERIVIEGFNLIAREHFTQQSSTNGPKVLFATCFAGNPAQGHWVGPVESILAKHLELACGADLEFAFCSRQAVTHNVYRGFGFNKFHLLDPSPGGVRLTAEDERLIESLDFSDPVKINKVFVRDIPVGRLAMASTRRTVAKSALIHPDDFRCLREKFTYGLRLLACAEELLARASPDAILTNHPTYVEHGGIFFHLGLRDGTPTSCWHIFDPGKCLIRRFSYKSRFENVIGPSEAEWEDLKARADREELVSQAREYLEKRRNGTLSFLPRQPRVGLAEQSSDLSALRFDAERPLIGVFTHLPWDAAGSFYTDLFPDHRAWVEATARVAVKNRNANWLFRLHPSEAVKNSVESTFDVLRRIVPADCGHVQIVQASDPLSSYALLDRLTAAVALRGTLSVELPCFGIPVLCAGTGVGTLGSYALTPTSAKEYEALLSTLHEEPRLSAEQIEEARLLAYGYFIYHVVGVECVPDMTRLRHFIGLNPEKIKQDPGLSRMAQVILDGIPPQVDAG